MITKESITKASKLYEYELGNVSLFIEKKYYTGTYFNLKSYLIDGSSWSRNNKVDIKKAVLRKSMGYRFESKKDNEIATINAILDFKNNIIDDYIKFRYAIDEQDPAYTNIKDGLKSLLKVKYEFSQ